MDLEQTKLSLQKQFEKFQLELLQKDIQREKVMNQFMQQLKEKESEIQDSLQYKTNYQALFKKVMKTYTDWSSKIKIF